MKENNISTSIVHVKEVLQAIHEGGEKTLTGQPPSSIEISHTIATPLRQPPRPARRGGENITLSSLFDRRSKT